MRQEGFSPAGAGDEALLQMRKARLRDVEENPKLWRFESVNFDLILNILNRVLPPNRAPFIRAFISTALESAPVAKAERFSKEPSWNGYRSGLGLLAEFCIRTGHSSALFDATHQLEVPSNPVAIMVRQIEEIIALNFTIFSEGEYDDIPERLAHLRRIAFQQTSWAIPGESPVGNPAYIAGLESEAQKIVESIDAVTMQCKQARYFYLKGALQETINIEVESDKTKVIGFLDSLGFDPMLSASLNKAEGLYSNPSDAFDLKSCLTHLRSFLEQLHAQACHAIAATDATLTAHDKWGLTTAFLRENGYLSSQEEKLVGGIHSIMSEDGVHPLIAEREYVRLLRNMVIEYGLLFLTMLEKKGIKIQASTP
jgi:hypothetical protein